MKNSIYLLYVFTILMLFVFFWLFIDFENCINILAPAENRELGLLELAQVVVLLFILNIIYSKFKIRFVLEKSKDFIGASIFCFVVFVILEEIDYGLHYYDYLAGNDAYSSFIAGFRNVHNQGDNIDYFKFFVISIQSLFLIIFPIFNFKIKGFHVEKQYTMFYLLITIGTYIVSLLFVDELNLADRQLFTNSQIFAELRELGWYTIFLSLTMDVNYYNKRINAK